MVARTIEETKPENPERAIEQWWEIFTPDIIAEAEDKGAMPQVAVDAMLKSGLWLLKFPAKLGGCEADLLAQFRVIEKGAKIYGPAGWNLMIGAMSRAVWAYLPDEGRKQILKGKRIPLAATVINTNGMAVRVPKGYRVTIIKAPFASGITYSDLINAAVAVEGEAPRMFTFPRTNVRTHGDWRGAAGLRGTGSDSFSMEEVFIPEELSFNLNNILMGLPDPECNSPLYTIGVPGILAVEHSGFASGIGKAVEEELPSLAQKRRGYSSPGPRLAEQATFQRDVGEAHIAMEAARELTKQRNAEAWIKVTRGERLTGADQATLRTSAVLLTNAVQKFIHVVFEYTGGGTVYQGNKLLRCKNDIDTAKQHLMVSNAAFEGYAQFCLGLPDANPMA